MKNDHEDRSDAGIGHGADPPSAGRIPFQIAHNIVSIKEKRRSLNQEESYETHIRRSQVRKILLIYWIQLSKITYKGVYHQKTINTVQEIGKYRCRGVSLIPSDSTYGYIT